MNIDGGTIRPDAGHDQAPVTLSARGGAAWESDVSRLAPRARQPWARLLQSVLALAGENAELLGHVEHDWATATFSGSRHEITLGFHGPQASAGEAFIMALPEHEFIIPRYLVADARIRSVDDLQLPERRLTVAIELLLLDRA